MLSFGKELIMGGSKVWKNVGRVVAGVSTGGVAEIANAASGGKRYGKKSGGKTAQGATEMNDGDNIEKTEGATGTAEGGEDIYSSGAMAMRKKKSTLIGSGDNTFSSTLGA